MIGSGDTPFYNSVILQNPQIKQFLDFKTLLFSDSQNKYTPQQCEQIYNGTMKINLNNKPKIVDGKIQLKHKNSEAQDILNKLKQISSQNKQKQGRNDYFGQDFDENDQDYEDVTDNEMFGYDEFEDEEFDYENYGFADEEEYIRYQEDQYYKQMLRDMEEDIDNDIYEEQNNDKNFKQNISYPLVLKKQEIQSKSFKNLENSKNQKDTPSTTKSNKLNEEDESSEEEGQDKNDDKKGRNKNHVEDEWQTESEEWEDEDDDDDEDEQ